MLNNVQYVAMTCIASTAIGLVLCTWEVADACKLPNIASRSALLALMLLLSVWINVTSAAEGEHVPVQHMPTWSTTVSCHLAQHLSGSDQRHY